MYLAETSQKDYNKKNLNLRKIYEKFKSEWGNVSNSICNAYISSPLYLLCLLYSENILYEKIISSRDQALSSPELS